MTRLKAFLAIATLAVCINGVPTIASMSTVTKGPIGPAPVTKQIAQPAYSTILTQGRGFWASLAINATFAVAVGVISASTGGAGAIAAVAAGVV